jgi:hypothetical protein
MITTLFVIGFVGILVDLIMFWPHPMTPLRAKISIAAGSVAYVAFVLLWILWGANR